MQHKSAPWIIVCDFIAITECFQITRIAIIRLRFSNVDMAIDFSASSARMPCQLRMLRSNFSALLNCRWKNDERASWSLRRK